MKRYAYGWITALFFLVSIAGHWLNAVRIRSTNLSRVIFTRNSRAI